jgi:two-component system sensor histidine kinase QseC
LGLTIVNTIATRLGGQITLVNRPEGGLRATLSIPDGPCSAMP